MLKYFFLILLYSSINTQKISELIFKIQEKNCPYQKTTLIKDFKNYHDKQEHYIINLYNIKNPYIDNSPIEFDLFIYNLNISSEKNNEEDILEMMKILDYLENFRRLKKNTNFFGIQNYIGCELYINKNKIEKIFIKVQKIKFFFSSYLDYEKKFYLADLFIKNYLNLYKLGFYILDFPKKSDFGISTNYDNEDEKLILFNIFYFYEQYLEKLEKTSKDKKQILNFEDNDNNIESKIFLKFEEKLINEENRQNYIYYYPKLIENCKFSSNIDKCKISEFFQNQQKWNLGLFYFYILDYSFFYEVNETLKCPHNFIDGYCIKNLVTGFFGDCENCQNLEIKEKIKKSLDFLFGIVDIGFDQMENYLGLVI